MQYSDSIIEFFKSLYSYEDLVVIVSCLVYIFVFTLIFCFFEFCIYFFLKRKIKDLTSKYEVIEKFISHDTKPE